MALNGCLEPGCDQLGVFPGERVADDGSTVTGAYCFAHDQQDGAPNDPDVAPIAADDPLDGYHPDVTAGLAAMILEHTAMTTLDGDDPTGDAMRSLAKNTGMTLDVAAGMLLACTSIAAAGEVPADRLTELAEVWERSVGDDDQADEVAPVEVGPDDDRDNMAIDCPACDGTGTNNDPLMGDNHGTCVTCMGSGYVDVTGPNLSLVGDDEEVLPASIVPGEPMTESET